MGESSVQLIYRTPTRMKERLLSRVDEQSISFATAAQDKLCAPGWDLAIFDEAHKLAADYLGSKLEKLAVPLRGKLGAHARHLPLMTASAPSQPETEPSPRAESDLAPVHHGRQQATTRCAHDQVRVSQSGNPVRRPSLRRAIAEFVAHTIVSGIIEGSTTNSSTARRLARAPHTILAFLRFSLKSAPTASR